MKTCPKCHSELKDKETCHCKLRTVYHPIDEKGFPLFVELPNNQLVRSVPKKKLTKKERRKLNGASKTN